jgi:hypothetical protein
VNWVLSGCWVTVLIIQRTLRGVRMHILSVHIQTVGFVPVATVVQCYHVGATWHRDGV